MKSSAFIIQKKEINKIMGCCFGKSKRQETEDSLSHDKVGARNDTQPLIDQHASGQHSPSGGKKKKSKGPKQGAEISPFNKPRKSLATLSL